MYLNINKYRTVRLVFLFSVSTFIIFSPSHIYSQQSNITFQHFSIAQGLYESIDESVIQDRDGYLWFGTWGGIQKFDGYQFTTYKHELNNSSSIDNAFVQTLFEDREGIIWVGTFNGLEKFDKRNGSFTHYKPHEPGPETEWSNHVYSICEDKYGILWVGTGDGLNKFDKNSNKFICIRNDNKNPGSISSNNVNVIYEDKAGSLWFGTGSGLDKLDRKTNKFIHFWYDPNNKSEWSNYCVNTIFEDKSGIIWLGTREGLVAFDQKAGTFAPYLKEERNSISSICEDESGHLWIGSLKSGLYSFNKKTKMLTNYLHDDKDPGSLSSNSITSICFERSGTIWITTFDGVNKLNISRKAFLHYQFDKINSIVEGRNNKIWINTQNGLKKLDSQTGQIVQSPINIKGDHILYEDDKGSLWFAEADGGLIKQDKLGNITKFFTPTGEEFKYFVDLIYETSDRNIWISTSGEGLFFLNLITRKINRVNIPAAHINCIYEDALGLIWIGSFTRGLYSYDRKTDSIKSYIYNPKDTTSISGQTILVAREDKNGILWFGTNGGLNKYDPSTSSFTHFTDKNGILSGATFSILIDKNGNFWFNTRNGISKFNPATSSLKNYGASDGLPENGFMDWRGVQSDDGRIYFANSNELIGFLPDDIRNNNFIPPIVITNFLILDKSFPIKNKIELSHTENFISFEFAALNYVSTEKNQYAYKMEGVDKDWVYSGTRRFVSYPNLDPGEYIFSVKGSNNDGVWNESGTSIRIIILPPFWETWFAYLSYASLFIFALYGIRRYEMNRISYKNQVELDTAVMKEREETDVIKSRFFANISHEFRTPLTLILGPAEKIISQTSDDVIKDANIIKRNSRRLLQLINQLLDLSKLESGKLKLEASKGNIVSFVKGVALSFESLAESKDITLKLMSEKDFIELYFDKEKMMKILTNILSNAFKFTPDEGTIAVSINSKPPSFPPLVKGELQEGSVEIRINDTGIGIPQEEIPKLFDRFYQVDSSFTKEYEGTGLGLALTKELVELHRGKINVESKIGDSQNKQTGLPSGQAGWTEFLVTLPLGSSHLQADEIITTVKTQTSIVPVEQESYESELNENTFDSKAISNTDWDNKDPSEEKTIILVVEDNYDMREYIKQSLVDKYQVEEAVNGEQGVRKAEKIIPDLIITDMMMPRMDGNELTNILKNNEKTNHIPIVLLTARSGQENKIEGLETGADDYLTKPFEIKELLARIDNLIKIRRQLQAKFSKIEYFFNRSGKRERSLDEVFLHKIMEVIDKHISEEEFSIEDFGTEVGMSRTQFHRKFKAITGKTASMFLRSVRLVRARKMIEQQRGNISEIAYSVGFSSPSYFSKCFKEEFGFPPSNLID